MSIGKYQLWWYVLVRIFVFIGMYRHGMYSGLYFEGFVLHVLVFIGINGMYSKLFRGISRQWP